MDDASRLIAEITGCDAETAVAAVDALRESGWSPPALSEQSDVGTKVRLVANLDALPPGAVLVAHTDGACSSNPGPGGWGIVFSVDGSVVAEFSGGEPETTNNRMELTAAKEAISRAPLALSLEIVTDSQNVIGWLTGKFKRNNPFVAALCKEIDAMRLKRDKANGGPVTFRYVRGHKGNPLNERADKLATAAIEKCRARSGQAA
jgi:ribonuclease HI